MVMKQLGAHASTQIGASAWGAWEEIASHGILRQKLYGEENSLSFAIALIRAVKGIFRCLNLPTFFLSRAHS